MKRAKTAGPFPQLLLDTHDELLVDLFAGGGGASLGIYMATGREVDVAINHDPIAVALHKANHPQTHHETADVFEIDPREATKGRPVALLWASPDCVDHSKAKGGKPYRESARKRRALAWVVKRWAGQVRPRVIALENVEEFAQWCPLIGPKDSLRRDPKRKGKTFRRFVRDLRELGYEVEWREIRASSLGAPTIRKRLFLVARCDGRPIVWPEATHGVGKLPVRTTSECIDWSIPMCSIFATREEARAWGRAHGRAAPRRPLAEKTMGRIARGVKRFVLDAAKPFVVLLNHGGGRDNAPRDLDDPMRTLTASRDAHGLVVPVMAGVGGRAGQSRERSAGEPYQTITAKADAVLLAPYLVPRYGERDGQEPRVRSVEEPAPAIAPTGNGASLVAGFLAKHFTGVVGSALDQPKGTVTTIDHDSLVAAHLSTYYGDHDGADDGATRGAGLDEPLRTQGTANRHALVAAFLSKYYGQGIGSALDDPAGAVTTKDRMALVTVEIDGATYVLVDIAMRMLVARELFNAQGFPDWYAINVKVWDEEKGKLRWLIQEEQVRLVGNSVVPQVACAIVRSNLPELRARDEVAA